MKERPILFSAPMVRALIAGTKTQTRRVVKPFRRWSSQYPILDAVACAASRAAWWWDGVHKHVGVMQHCPYGVPGDRLWVRETFFHEPADYCWEASVSIPSRPAHTVYRADVAGDSRGAGWKPSIHMPRKHSRITLELTDVRVERLQEISEADAEAEGIDSVFPTAIRERAATTTRIGCYRLLWEAINGAGSWDTNPWVWALSFKRVD